jgi:hypothetical protein
MAYTAIHRDTGYGYYGGNSLPHSEATPQPSSHEIDHTNVPPSHCVPTVSVFQCVASFSSMTILFLRLHFPCTVLAMPLNGMHPRCTLVFRTSSMACLCHITMWPAAIVFGLTRSRVLRSLLWGRWRVLFSLEHSRIPKFFSSI